MKADSCSIFNGESGAADHVGWDLRATEATASGPGNGHTHVSVNIVVCLGGWALPLCC